MLMKYVFHNKFRLIIFQDQKALSLNFKSSRLQMFFEITVLKNFAIVTVTKLEMKNWAPLLNSFHATNLF